MLTYKPIDSGITPKEIRLLAKWRKSVQQVWRETFKVTYKGTKIWINKIINDPKKLYFFVIKNDEYIGQLGFDKIGGNDCYIGMVIRGEGKSDGSMTAAMKFMITLSKKFGTKNIYLLIHPDMSHAIQFYEKIGFRFNRKVKEYSRMKYEG